jgi:hypothetical protein
LKVRQGDIYPGPETDAGRRSGGTPKNSEKIGDVGD